MAKFKKKLAFSEELPRRIATQLGNEWLEKNREVIQEIRSWRTGRFGTTKRKNGNIVSDPRNIVDTGDLLRSLKISMVDNTVRLQMAGHGKYVIMGANGVPPRNFPLEAAERINYTGVSLENM